VRELTVEDGDLETAMTPLLEARRVIRDQVRVMTRMIESFVRKDSVCRRLMTAPGVGPLTALAFKTAIDDPGRFRKSRNVGVHLGLTPRKYASGEVDINGGITRCGDDFARKHLYEAAHALLINTRR
jgi:transposase